MKRIAVFFTMLAALLLAGPQLDAAPKAPKATGTFAIFIIKVHSGKVKFTSERSLEVEHLTGHMSCCLRVGLIWSDCSPTIPALDSAINSISTQSSNRFGTRKGKMKGLRYQRH